MNREIKFRAFTRRWGMVYPENHDYEIYVHAQAVWKMGCDEEGVELMQFTGLQDYKNNDLYEGDIVLLDAVEKLEIVYYEGAFMLESEDGCDLKYLGPINCCCELIGNVFENKELLQA
jgi:hypothetical protein